MMSGNNLLHLFNFQPFQLHLLHPEFQLDKLLHKGTYVGVQTDDVVPAAPVMTDITCLLELPVPPVLTVASAPAAVYDEPAPMIEYMTLGYVVTYTAPAPVLKYVPDDTNEAPAPEIKHVSFVRDDTYIAQTSPRVNRDIRCLVNPQFSSFAVEASASQVVGSFPAVEESAPPVYKQVHQEHVTAEPGSFERTQQCNVENIFHVPIPQIQEQFVESVQKIFQERLPERIEEPIENTPVPHSICYSAPTPVIEDISPAVPASEYVAPAPVIEPVEPAPPRASRQHHLRPTHFPISRYVQHTPWTPPAWRARDVPPLNFKLATSASERFGNRANLSALALDRISLASSRFSTPGKTWTI